MKIEEFDFYSELSPQEQDILKGNLKPISLDKKSILFYQGDITKDILFLTKGEVRVYIQGDGISEITLYTLNPNEQCIVNTTSAINQTPAIGSAITSSAIKGYMLNRDIVIDLMQKNNNYQKYIFSLLTLRLDSLARLLENIKFKHLDERIYEWLKAQNTKEITVTHEELANIIGSTRVVVSRTLKKLKNEDLILLKRGKIILK